MPLDRPIHRRRLLALLGASALAGLSPSGLRGRSLHRDREGLLQGRGPPGRAEVLRRGAADRRRRDLRRHRSRRHRLHRRALQPFRQGPDEDHCGAKPRGAGLSPHRLSCLEESPRGWLQDARRFPRQVGRHHPDRLLLPLLDGALGEEARLPHERGAAAAAAVAVERLERAYRRLDRRGRSCPRPCRSRSSTAATRCGSASSATRRRGSSARSSPRRSSWAATATPSRASCAPIGRAAATTTTCC